MWPPEQSSPSAENTEIHIHRRVHLNSTQKDLYLGYLSKDSKILTRVIILETVKGH